VSINSDGTLVARISSDPPDTNLVRAQSMFNCAALRQIPADIRKDRHPVITRTGISRAVISIQDWKMAFCMQLSAG